MQLQIKTVLNRVHPLKSFVYDDVRFSGQGERPTWAGKFLDAWCTRTMRSRIEPMKKFARTLRNHRDLILNYFRAKKQLNSGIVEGMNNKLKLATRKSYGFRSAETLKTALYHTLGDLPTPPQTHRFVR